MINRAVLLEHVPHLYYQSLSHILAREFPKVYVYDELINLELTQYPDSIKKYQLFHLWIHY